MIDFSNITAVTIPEGEVVDIERKSDGETVWTSAVKKYVSLGDSIAAGHTINGSWDKDYGERSQFDYGGRTAPTALVKGCYTDLIRDDMMAKHGNKKVLALSFARSGDRVSALIDKLSNPIVRSRIAKADVVTVCIGANDVLQDAMKGLDYYINTGDLASIQSKIDENMAVLNENSNGNSYMSLFNKLTDINPNAQYVFTTVYNPYKYLWIEEGRHGFFEPVLDGIPQMNMDIDEIIEDIFNFDDLGYWDALKWEWVSIDLELDIDNFIKDSLLGTPAVEMLFNRVNRISNFTEGCVTQLNTVLKTKIKEKHDAGFNFSVVDSKALFDTFPDRTESAIVHYNDLVHVAFTRGYNTSVMDWGALWRDEYGKGEGAAAEYYADLALKHMDFTNALPSTNVWDYVNFDINGFAEDLVNQIIDKVIVPNVDPHPTATGHSVLKQSFEDEVNL